MVNSKVFEKCENLIKQCLHDARVEVQDVSDVVVVGGCSYIPRIRKLLLEITTRKALYEGMDPLEAAVPGAALEGAVASGIGDPFGSLYLLSIQATPLAIGIRADGSSFIPIIPKNTTVPARKELVFITVQDNQSEALIVVYEGEETRAEENHLLGYFKIIGIPPAPKGVPEVTICMDIDSSNMLRVLAGATLPGTQHPATLLEVRMPTVDDGHGWCAEAPHGKYGAAMDSVTLRKKN